MKPLTLESIRSFKRVGSRCRNPRIALTFNHMHKMEKLGFGIPSMPILLRRHGLRPPDFDYFDGYFVVTLFGRALSPISIQIKADVFEKLNKRQLEALDLIQKYRKITSEEFTKQFQISRETANQDFKKLIDLQLIRKMGRGRGTYYVLRWQSWFSVRISSGLHQNSLNSTQIRNAVIGYGSVQVWYDSKCQNYVRVASGSCRTPYGTAASPNIA